MPDFKLVILYVDSPAASAVFCASLLGQEPAEILATFALFPCHPGSALAFGPAIPSSPPLPLRAAAPKSLSLKAPSMLFTRTGLREASSSRSHLLI